jgi:hypothetical protein
MKKYFYGTLGGSIQVKVVHCDDAVKDKLGDVFCKRLYDDVIIC